MISFECIDIVGWEAAIRGMRNPMNSWDKSDSIFRAIDTDAYTINGDTFPWPSGELGDVIIGPNDLELMKKLAMAGTDHAKYRRMIVVYMDITAPLYWWKEFDTYKVGTVANSCSTMHKIAEKEFTMEDFSCEHLGYYDPDKSNSDQDSTCVDAWNGGKIWPYDELCDVVGFLNHNRERYLETHDKLYWWQMIQLLPSSYNQKRTVMTNYEVLANIYKSRKNHKLNEWVGFCRFISTFPYSELITMEVKDE
jgi:hypothetical protein